jgi:hypothetical protein
MESRLFFPLSVHMHLVFACCARDYERDFSPAAAHSSYARHRSSDRKQLHFLRESGTGAARATINLQRSSSVSKTIVHIRRKIMIQMSELSKQEFAEKRA